MAIIRNAANTIMKGRVGETTYYVSLGRQVARQRLNNSNYGKDARRTESQQSRRVRWANLVNFYKVSKFWQPKAYETLRKGQTDYNRFMQLNVPVSTISLTKQMAESGACIAEAYLVSQGSLPSIEVNAITNAWTTNIALGSLSITDSTTVAEFSEAVVNNNEAIKEGMQLSFVSYMQTVDAIGVPRLICTLYEVTLSMRDGTKLRDYMPDFCSQSVNQMLATSQSIAVGAFAYILSSQLNGKIEVSTQRLITFNADLISEYSSATNQSNAIDSYGLDYEVILSPMTTKEQGSTSKPQYIQYVSIGSKTYNSGSVLQVTNAQWANDIVITMASAVAVNDINNVTITAGNTGQTQTTLVQKTENSINAQMPGTAPTDPIKRIEVKMKTGDIYKIEFSTNTGGEDVGA